MEMINRATQNTALNLQAVRYDSNGRRYVVNIPVEILPLNTFLLGITIIISLILGIIILG